ncbi:MAG: cytochrome c [Myxococcota bacterium]|nr:cytochrome c [Myxococcota bacterium]
MKIKKSIAIAVGVLALSSTAYAFPWDIDLVDTPYYRGYEWRMMKPADNAVSQNNYRPFKQKATIIPVQGVPMIVSGAGRDKAVVDQKDEMLENQKTSLAMFASPEEMMETGQVMTETYCGACHQIEEGDNKMAPVARAENREGEAVNRWPGAHKVLVGPTSAVPNYNDLELYYIIRNGNGQMPAYGHAMYDHEIWASIEYIKSKSPARIETKQDTASPDQQTDSQTPAAQ